MRECGRGASTEDARQRWDPRRLRAEVTSAEDSVMHVRVFPYGHSDSLEIDLGIWSGGSPEHGYG
jgi:hypothetical protein